MREIKFRVWNTETNKMITNVKEMGVFALKSIYTIDEFLVIPTNEKYPLMQYTGLKDKNGVEIYEGDIVYISGLGNYQVEFPFIELYEACYENDIGNILGNIYENKDLLDD